MMKIYLLELNFTSFQAIMKNIKARSRIKLNNYDYFMRLFM